MAKNRIEINGSIDSWGYGSRFLRWQLKDCDEGPVTIVVNSYGGDVNEALAMGNMIAEHGNITVEYVAYNASAATLLGLYAKKSVINSDALFMIHKTSVWVDTWGQMNEDQIESAIEELKEKKDMAAVSTLQLAKCYSEKSGKIVSEILSMMKEAKWLTPEEAVKAGFVDEVIQSKCKKKTKVANSVADLFASNGIPLPGDCIEKEEVTPKSFAAELFEEFSKLFRAPRNSTNPIHNTMNKKFTYVNNLLNVEGFEVQNDSDSVTLTVEQLNALNSALQNAEQKNSEHKTVLDGLDALDDSVANAASSEEKLEAVKTLLNNRPGVATSNQIGNDKHDTTVDYEPDEINNYFKQN